MSSVDWSCGAAQYQDQYDDAHECDLLTAAIPHVDVDATVVGREGSTLRCGDGLLALCAGSGYGDVVTMLTNCLHSVAAIVVLDVHAKSLPTNPGGGQIRLSDLWFEVLVYWYSQGEW